MHELPVTERIAEVCLKHAQKNNAQHIRKVNIILGELTGIHDHHVSFYWDMVTRGTIAEGAELHFSKIPVRAFCPKCLNEFVVKDCNQTCLECGEIYTELISGQECLVEGIEVLC